MEKKYFTKEEKRLAKNLKQKKYYDNIKKQPLSLEEKELIKKERKDKREKYLKEYYIKNKEKILKNSKDYFKSNQKIKQEKNNKRYKERRNTDPLYKLITNLKRNIRAVVKKNGLVKKTKTIEIIGCSFDEFKQHIQSQFESWMTWENYGLYNGELNYGWDIDHIEPICVAITEEDVIRLNHYSNLKPLCSYTNRVVKRDNIVTVNKINNLSKISIK